MPRPRLCDDMACTTEMGLEPRQEELRRRPGSPAAAAGSGLPQVEAAEATDVDSPAMEDVTQSHKVSRRY